MSRAEILVSQEDQRYVYGKRDSELPDELGRRQDSLERIRQARMEIEAETAAAAAQGRSSGDRMLGRPGPKQRLRRRPRHLLQSRLS